MVLKICKILFIVSMMMNLLACDIINKNKKMLVQESEKFTAQILDRKDYIKNISKVLARDPEILNIYKDVKEKIGNFEKINEKREIVISSGHRLKYIFNEIIIKYERDFGLPVRYHFYLPPAKIWLIPDKPYGEDVILENKISEKPNVAEAISKAKLVSGIIPEKDILVFSSITPIQSETGEVLGAIEAWTDFSSIIDHYLMSNQKDKIIIILNKAYKKYFTKIPASLIFENGIIYYTNIEAVDYKKIVDTVLSLKENDFIKIDKRDFIVINIYDFTNQEIGKILLSIF